MQRRHQQQQHTVCSAAHDALCSRGSLNVVQQYNCLSSGSLMLLLLHLVTKTQYIPGLVATLALIMINCIRR